MERALLEAKQGGPLALVRGVCPSGRLSSVHRDVQSHCMQFFGRVTRARRRKGGDEESTLQGLELVRAGRCYLCGGLVEDGLARAGSPMCHDCRAGCIREPVRTHA